MELKQAFGQALKQARIRQNQSQEQLGPSQSFVSDVERGVKAVTLEKLQDFAEHLDVHPVSLLAITYLKQNPDLSLQGLLQIMESEINNLRKNEQS